MFKLSIFSSNKEFHFGNHAGNVYRKTSKNQETVIRNSVTISPGMCTLATQTFQQDDDTRNTSSGIIIWEIEF